MAQLSAESATLIHGRSISTGGIAEATSSIAEGVRKVYIG
jgi:hypothetical protein